MKKRIMFDVPIDMHTKIKAKASANGIPMSSYIKLIVGKEL